MPLHVIAPLALFQATAPRLHGFDLALIAVYLVAITLFGLRFRNAGKKGTDGKPDKSLKNYFLANRTVPWWAIALSIVSAETSTLTIISIPGVAFAGDFGFLQVVLGYMLGRIVVALIFLPKYFKGEMLTAYQLIDRRFGATLHKTTAGLFLLTRAAAEGVRVFAVSIVVGVAIGAGDTASIAIISFLTLLYTFEGGMAAVIWTDVVQMAIYVGGTVVAIFTLGAHVPGGGCRGGREVSPVQLCVQPYAVVYVLGGGSGWNFFDDGEPWNGSVDGAADAGCEESGGVAAGAAFVGGGDLFPVHAVSTDWGGALCFFMGRTPRRFGRMTISFLRLS